MWKINYAMAGRAPVCISFSGLLVEALRKHSCHKGVVHASALITHALRQVLVWTLAGEEEASHEVVLSWLLYYLQFFFRHTNLREETSTLLFVCFLLILFILQDFEKE